MVLNEKIIKQVISYELVIDFIEIKLTQNTEEDPIVFIGPGSITQTIDGILSLKMYHKIKDLAKEATHGLQHFEPGKIISDDNYFRFEGVDFSGKLWTSENVWVSGTISFPAAGRVIQTTLNEIVQIEEYKKSKENDNQTIIIICPGKYDFPCNEKEDLPNDGWVLNRSVFEANNVNFDIKTNDEYMTIISKFDSKEINTDYYFLILESLCIVSGGLVNAVLVNHYYNGGNITKIKRIDKNLSNKKVNQLFSHSKPHEIKSLATFVDRYLFFVNEPHSELFGFWYKINRAWQADIENISLTLTVSIEGLSKKYFSKYGAPDKEILAQATDAREIINDSGLEEKIKLRLLANLNNLNSPSPKSILYGMSKDGLIHKKFAEVWVKLRNKSAHATEIEPDQKTFQKHLDRINICLTLFYNLLFLILNYKGSYINYSEKGWPDKDFVTK